MLATRGLEHEVVAGLGWIEGDVAPIKPNDPALEDSAHGLEHARRDAKSCAFSTASGPAGELHAYFVHSYQLYVANSDEVVATAVYGGPVTALVARDNIAGTQFHPEKSQRLGLALIANFLRWRP